jgi:hypothetical protein
MALTSEKLRELLISKFMGPQQNINLSKSIEKEKEDSLEGESISELSKESLPNAFSPENISVSNDLNSNVDNLSRYKTLTPIHEELPPPPNVFSAPVEKQSYETTSDFYYLEDDPLSRNFRQNRNYENPHNINIVLYKINDSIDIPFLEFYFEKVDKSYEFPSKELNMVEFKNIISSASKILPNQETEPMFGGEPEDEDINEIEEEFLSQCSAFFSETTGLTQINAANSYRGFLEEKGGSIFLFYDATYLEFSKGSWAILDEIINKHRIADVSVKESNYILFYENPNLLYIKNENKEPIEIPISAYICNKDGKNSHHNKEEDYNNSTSLIDEKFEHPVFRQVYLFSYEPIEYDNLNLIKRYALFTKETIYFLNTDFELTPDMNIDIGDNTRFSFYKDGKLFWALKSVEDFLEL